jgi:putative hydrolase of the HAD superfamily
MLERDGLGHLLDVRLYTCELEYMKPHPDAFARILDAVGVDAERAVYVGDRLFDDIFGAQRAGMRAIHRPNPHVPAHEAVPDATIERLSEIPGILDAWAAHAG